MEVGISSARQARTKHRHELRTLTYVTLDQANGGIVRNLTHDGIGVQVVAAVRPRQQLRVRFELRYPRLRVETRGEVVWATFSGQCGIRFLDMTPRMTRQINEWIFGNLLEGATLHPERDGSMFAEVAETLVDDGLVLSPVPRNVISLPVRREAVKSAVREDRVRKDLVPEDLSESVADEESQSDWLSQPLSGRGLVWTVNGLVVVASLLLFALVFLSVNREAPPWPLATAFGAAILVAALYWGFFKTFAGSSLGTKLARLAESDMEEEEARADRFR
jgi:PilZ domain-containing protein